VCEGRGREVQRWRVSVCVFTCTEIGTVACVRVTRCEQEDRGSTTTETVEIAVES
jgi:hypothetical protein